jgi:transposase
MKHKKFSLSDEDKKNLEELIKPSREVIRAKVLLSLNEGKKQIDIAKEENINSKTVGRIKHRYMKEGLGSTLHDKPRSGQPKKYKDKEEAEIISLVCSDPPEGRKNWSIRLVTETLRKKEGFKNINRESVRLILKKAK